jgi:hypothetical protein
MSDGQNDVASGAQRFGMPEALAELGRCGVINIAAVRQVPLRRPGEDGTTGVVALDLGAGPELVVKIDDPSALSAAIRYHETYRGAPLIPALRHADPESRFVAYDWVPGELGRGLEPPPDKATTLVAIAEGLLSQYVPVPSGNPGRLHAPWLPPNFAWRTWQQFLGAVLYGRHDQVHAHLPSDAAALVKDLAASPHRHADGPLYLMHGDCGAHNFVFRDGRLVAVIDPAPMVGEPIFELAFAFASWPADLTLDAIMPAAEVLERSGRWHPPPRARRRALVEEVLISLYSRVGTFVVNRPDDVPAYLDAWTRWTGLLTKV